MQVGIGADSFQVGGMKSSLVLVGYRDGLKVSNHRRFERVVVETAALSWLCLILKTSVCLVVPVHSVFSVDAS